MNHEFLRVGIGAALAVGLSGAGTAAAAPAAALHAMRHHQRHIAGRREGHSFWKSFLITWTPLVVSGVLALYGLIVGLILASHTLQISTDPTDPNYVSPDTADRMLAAGLAVGLPCLVSGMGMGAFLSRFDSAGIPHSLAQNGAATATAGANGNGETALLLSHDKAENVTAFPIWVLFWSLAFVEAIGLYGLIVALVLSS